jgi:trigger factor
MLKTLEDISATRKRLHIEIPSDAIEDEIKNSLNRLRANTRIPGFRQGKAPLALIEKRFGKDAESEAVEKAVPKFYSRALKEADITPVVQPVIEGSLEFKRETPLNFTVVVEVMPRLETLSYEEITVKEIPLEVTDSDLETTIARLREEKAVYEPSGEPVADGDLVVMDYEVREDGKSYKDEVFKVGSDVMPESFSKNLIGLKKSGEAEFDVTFPDDHHSKEMAGREVGFEVTIKDIKKVTLPAIDDEFAKDLGYDNMEALREKIKERLEKSKEDTVARMLKAEVLKKALEDNEFEAPESLVEAELGHALNEAKAKGRKDSDEVLREELRPAAERQIRASLLLQIIGEKEGIEVGEEDMTKKISQLSTQINLTPENVMKYYVARDGSLEGLRQSLMEDKVLDLLLERAVVEKGE